MAATPLTSTTVNRTVSNGVDLTAAGTAVDAANGNVFTNSGDTLFRMKTSGTAITVTIKFAQQAIDGITLSGTTGITVTMPATGDRLIGPFPVAVYGNQVTVTFSVSTGGTCYVYEPSN